MKPSPQFDFPVSVRHQIWEEEPDVSALYQGIFDLILNHEIGVMFVPEFEKNAREWPPRLPDNIDEIKTEREARLISVALSKYSVTPDSSLAGQEEIIAREGRDSPTQGIIFYVTPQEFETFSAELSELADQMPAVHSAIKISEIENLEVAKFILFRALTSPYLSEKELEKLGRKRRQLVS